MSKSAREILMHQNKDLYNISIAYSSSSGLHIRNFRVSKKVVSRSIVSVLSTLLFLLVGFAITKVYSLSYQLIKIKGLEAQNFVNIDLKSRNIESINGESGEMAQDSGGPAPQDFMLGQENGIIEVGQETGPIEESKFVEVVSTLPLENLPNLWPREDKINSEFGFRRNPFGGRTYEFHAGIDIGGDRGDPVFAAGGGVITKAGWQGGYGNMIEIDHGFGVTTRYGHLSKVEVQIGDVVSKGQQIGLVGSTGRSTGAHLHYELRINEKTIDPRKLLPPEKVDF
jgi:murein DD-endopeptidase MepM/ murein hydrolase activator NlpD